MADISATKIQAGDVLEHLRFIYNADPSAFIKTFNDIGVPIRDGSDLPELADLIITGKDKAGFVKDLNGNPIRFDGMFTALYKVPISNQSIKNAGIKIVT